MIVIIGSGGYFGSAIKATLEKHFSVYCLNRSLDQKSQSYKDINLRSVECVIYAAGEKDLNKCQIYPDIAFDANFTYLKKVKEYFPEAPLIYFSSDYVFDGETGFYDRNTKPSPNTVYGHSKVKAENWLMKTYPDSSCILRISALFSQSSAFVSYLRNNLKQGRVIPVAYDSFFSPTPLNLAVDLVLETVKEFTPGLYHFSGPRMSRKEFSQSVKEVFKLKGNLEEHPFLSINEFLRKDLSLINSFFSDVSTSRTIGKKLSRVMDMAFSLEDFT